MAMVSSPYPRPGLRDTHTQPPGDYIIPTAFGMLHARYCLSRDATIGKGAWKRTRAEL